MGSLFWMATVWVDVLGFGHAPPRLLIHKPVESINLNLQGQLLDFTHNHGHDRRIWSPALGQCRDLYVYLPPGYCPNKKYPITIFLHGAAQDEQFFVQSQLHEFDRAMANGLLPPGIIAIPDGSMTGKASVVKPATFWCNSRAGCFEDYVMVDVWNFLVENFPIRPEREAHALVGVSMGGSATFALAIKHRERFKIAIGFMPLLNLRYGDCRGRYKTPFDPCCYALRDKIPGYESLGRRHLATLRFGELFGPLYGKGDDLVAGMSSINPLELMENLNLKPGELDLYIAYGGKDEFNVAAQVESFLCFSRQRGLDITVDYDPKGKHDLSTGMRQLPAAMRWVSDKVPLPK